MFKEGDLTRGIIGIAMKVHRELGPGFKERIYHSTLLMIFESTCRVDTEVTFEVRFENMVVGKFRADLVVGAKVIVEIKAVSGKMPKIFQSQLVSYLKASGLEVGLLLNFGNPSLEFQRIVNYKKFA